MSAVRKLRLHYKDGRVVTEPLTRFASANGLHSIADAKALVARWVADGDLKLRTDGGYDVIRYRPRAKASDRGSASVAAVLAICIFGALLFLAAVTAGQRAMCATHHDQLRYCAHYQETAR